MNQYVTGTIIRQRREEKEMTQHDLAEKLSLSDKTISKWETGKGFPDVTLLEPLANSLGISVIELMSGSNVINRNRSFQMMRSRFYVCPLCGNAIVGAGEAVISCCGITLPPLEAESPDEEHRLNIEAAEDEYYVTAAHPMSKNHYISFIAALRDDGVSLVKLYPEGGAEACFKISRTRRLVWYCNRHGLFQMPISPRKRSQ